jgi:PKD repeat protein
MRPIRWTSRAVISTGLAFAGLALVGCGKDSNGPDNDNVAPTAHFTYACTDLACTFTDLSSDSDGTVDDLAWDFGDGQGSGSATPSHTYAVGGTFTVTLTATDNDGDETSVSKDVAVTDPGSGPSNSAPTADFAIACASLTCTFTDASTDADGSIATWEWDFGDSQTSTATDPPAHTYAATGLATFTVKLKVTDDGGLSSTKSVQITVAPPATLACNGVACKLVLPERSTVQVTLQSRECTARNNSFRITAPAEEVLLTDGCYTPAVGTPWDLNGGGAYEAGTELEAAVTSGSIKLETAPALRVTGDFASGWTLEFDDGEDATPPEPDFNDLVIRIVATPAP